MSRGAGNGPPDRSFTCRGGSGAMNEIVGSTGLGLKCWCGVAKVVSAVWFVPIPTVTRPPRGGGTRCAFGQSIAA